MSLSQARAPRPRQVTTFLGVTLVSLSLLSLHVSVSQQSYAHVSTDRRDAHQRKGLEGKVNHQSVCSTMADCHPKLMCLGPTEDLRCRCLQEHAFAGDIAGCVHFSQFNCSEHAQCQDIDHNLVCSPKTNKCKCRAGFRQDIDTKLCTHIDPSSSSSTSNTTTYPMSRSTLLVLAKLTNPTSYFEPHHSCISRHDCAGSYTHCYLGECRCWPDFVFVSARYLSENENDTTDNEQWPEQSPHTLPKPQPLLRRPNVGFCVRKICSSDAECRQRDNPNLICNNTICECRYGYHMQRNYRVCVRNFEHDLPGCNTTCRIVGGVFALIFLLTLTYWCSYCIYHIIRNFYHRHVGGGGVYPAGSLTNSGWLAGSFNSLGTRASLFDPPPSYESLKLNYEMTPPKYEAAIAMAGMSEPSGPEVDSTPPTQLLEPPEQSAEVGEESRPRQHDDDIDDEAETNKLLTSPKSTGNVSGCA